MSRTDLVRIEDDPMFQLGAKAQLETVLWHINRIQTDKVDKGILLHDLRNKRGKKLNLAATQAHEKEH